MYYKCRFLLLYSYKPFFKIRIILELLGDGAIKVVIVTNCYVCDDIVKHEYVSIIDKHQHMHFFTFKTVLV